MNVTNSTTATHQELISMNDTENDEFIHFPCVTLKDQTINHQIAQTMISDFLSTHQCDSDSPPPTLNALNALNSRATLQLGPMDNQIRKLTRICRALRHAHTHTYTHTHTQTIPNDDQHDTNISNKITRRKTRSQTRTIIDEETAPILKQTTNSDSHIDIDTTSPKKTQLRHLEQWQRRYQDLVAFYNEHGHSNVQHKYAPNPALSHWVHNQRRNRKKNILTSTQIQALNNIEFPWEATTKSIAWQRRYQDLVAFYETHGHTKVPKLYHSSRSLSQWICIQRRKKKEQLLSSDQIESLETIDFQWGNDTNVYWETQYQELATFYEQNGHSNIPNVKHSNRSLSHWICSQRRKKRDNLLSPSQIQALDTIQFPWKSETFDIRWQNRYQELTHFYDNHGHSNIPSRDSSLYSLYQWINTQRLNRRNNLLPSNRIEALDKLHFQWDREESDHSWQLHYNDLAHFYNTNGHTNVTDDKISNASLHRWSCSQRRFQRDHLLLPTRVEALNKLQFPWEAQS